MRVLIFVYLLSCSLVGACQQKEPLFFNFGKEVEGGLQVSASSSQLTKKKGIVFSLTGNPVDEKSFITTSESFAFFVKIPEGNYRVKVALGDPNGTSNTTIKAESRRLMVYDYTTASGSIDTVEFLVSVRSARIDESDSIRLKSREFDYLNWDEFLSLEFGGERPCVQAVSLMRDDAVPTIFLTGNSTVVDQDKEPWASWGQMFPLFLKPEVVVSNYAESGETLKAFIREKRLQKIATQIKPGDYIFMEFAHNDQKPGGNHVEPYSSYQDYLMKFVQLARDNDATPVLVTSTNRRVFDENGEIVNTLEEYPDAMRQLAQEENITLVDLNAMSKTFYESLGPTDSKKAFVHYPANTFSWQPKALADDTHFSTYGAWQLARSVVESIRNSKLPLKKYLKDDIGPYDPAKPDPYQDWKWPISKDGSSSKPEGY